MWAKFPPPIQTGPEGPSSFLYKGHRISFRGVKRPRRGVNHPPPSKAEVKDRVELYLYSPSGPLWPVLGRNLILRFKDNFQNKSCTEIYNTFYAQYTSSTRLRHFCPCRVKLDSAFRCTRSNVKIQSTKNLVFDVAVFFF